MGSNRKRAFRWLSQLTCLICWALVGLPGQAQGTQPVEVRVAPATLQVAVNQTANVAVEVRDVTGLYGADIALSFNPTAVEVVDADANTAGVQVALGTFLDAGFTLRNTADNAAGTVRFALTQLNPSEAKSGSGVIIVIPLRGKQIGAGTPLTLTSVQLAQRDGTKLATTLVSGQIEVVATAAGPTATPIPTQAPGTTMPTATRTAPPAARPPTSQAPLAEAPTATRRPQTSTPPAVRTPTAQAATATRSSPTSAPPAVRTPTAQAPPAEPPAATRSSQTSAPPAVAAPAPSNTPGGATAGQVRPTATVTTVVSRSTALVASPLAPTRSAGTTVAKLLPGSAVTPAAAASSGAPDSSARLFLVVGLSLLGLAALLIVIGAGVFVARRRRHLPQTKGE